MAEANPENPSPQPVSGKIRNLLQKRIAVLLALLTATTVLGLFARHHWLADLCANLRTQQVLVLVTLQGATILFRHWQWLAVSVVLSAIHLPWYAAAIVGAPHAGQTPELTVMVMNVLTSNRNFRAIDQEVERAAPDVLAVLELGSPLASHLDEVFAATYPHRIAIPQDDGNFGIGLYSKYPLLQVDRFALNVPSIETIAATMSLGDKEYRIVATHPLPPIGARGSQYRNEHLQQLAVRIAEFRSEQPEIPMLVLGDLNLTPWSPLFSDLETSTQLTRAGRGYGWTPTWYARWAIFPMGLVLDHCLISDDLQCVSYRVGADMGSDHRPVIAGLASRK